MLFALFVIYFHIGIFVLITITDNTEYSDTKFSVDGKEFRSVLFRQSKGDTFSDGLDSTAQRNETQRQSNHPRCRDYG